MSARHGALKRSKWIISSSEKYFPGENTILILQKKKS